LINQIRNFEKDRIHNSESSFLQENVSEFAMKLKKLMEMKSHM